MTIKDKMEETMTEEHLTEIEEVLSKAHPAPWGISHPCDEMCCPGAFLDIIAPKRDGSGYVEVIGYEKQCNSPDADAIVLLRNAVPDLVKALRTARAEAKEYREVSREVLEQMLQENGSSKDTARNMTQIALRAIETKVRKS